MRSVKSLFAAAATALLSTAAVAADVPSIVPPPQAPYPQAYPQPAYPQPAYPQPAYSAPVPAPVYAQPAPQVYAGGGGAAYGGSVGYGSGGCVGTACGGGSYFTGGGGFEDFGGWYLRGDIGMSNQKVGSLFNVLYNAPGTTVNAVGMGFDSAGIAGLGVGYQINPWLRTDVTAEWRGKANFHGLDIVSFNGAPIGTDEYHASKSEFLTLVNLYADLGTWWCITPFIGAGVGGSYNQLSGFQDNGVRYTAGALSNSVTYFDTNGKWNLAWAAHAGLAYKVNPGFTVELAYSYMNLGDAAPGNFHAFDGSIAGPSTIKVRNITSNDVKLGVRWELNSPPVYAPPPLVTKG